MSNYLMLNDRRIELSAELAEMLAQTVKKEMKKVDPFARTAECNPYYYISCYGDVVATTEDFEPIDSDNYAVANYCTDEELMEQRALRETLNRLLWRYSEQHGGDSEWGSTDCPHYYVYFNEVAGEWGVSCDITKRMSGGVYFKEGWVAKKAIEEIVYPFLRSHPELKW